MSINFLKIKQEKLDSMFKDVRHLEYDKMIKNLNKFTDIKEELKSFIDTHVERFANFNFGNNILDKYYEAHLFRVTAEVAKNICSENVNAQNTLKVAFLHNALEKNYMSEDELEKECNSWVSNSIRALTQNREAANDMKIIKSYYLNLSLMPKEVMLVKICDKYDNIPAQCLKKDDSKRARYFNEIKEFISPTLKNCAPKLEEDFSTILEEAISLGYSS
jgi:hypothetical protein